MGNWNDAPRRRRRRQQEISMTYAINPVALDQLDGTKWPVLTVFVTVVNVGSGESVLVNADGNVRSWQPGGFWEDRPPGTAGVYERCILDGHVVTYRPDITQRPTQFAIGKVPN
jgi:hypothetical protein